MSQKLYVIGDTSPDTITMEPPSGPPPRKPSTAKMPRPVSPSAAVRPDTPAAAAPNPRPRQRRAGLLLVAAYLVGPLSAVFVTSGRARRRWLTAGLGCVSALGAMILGWGALTLWVESTSGGSVVWLAAVTLVPVAIFASWSRAIELAGRRWEGQPDLRFLNRGIAVGLGIAVPGLGFHLTGRSKRAARAFGILGPLVAATVILTHWRWLWNMERFGRNGTMAATALEITFMVVAAVSAVMLLLWSFQTVRAVQLVPSERRRARPGSPLLLSLAAVIFLAGTQVELPLADVLHDRSTALRSEGFRWMPLHLSQASAYLDPTRPIYLVDVATLNDTLGRPAKAQVAREMLSDRTLAFQTATRLASQPVATTSDPAWPRIQALFR